MSLNPTSGSGIKKNPFMAADQLNKSISADKQKSVKPNAKVLQADTKDNSWSTHKKLALLGIAGIVTAASTSYSIKAYFDYDGENIIPLVGCSAVAAISGTIAAYVMKQLFENAQNHFPATSVADDILNRLPVSPKRISRDKDDEDPENLDTDRRGEEQQNSPQIFPVLPIETIPEVSQVGQLQTLNEQTTYTTKNRTTRKQRAALDPENAMNNPFPTTLPDFFNVTIGTVNNSELYPSILPPIQTLPVINQDLTSTGENDPIERQDDSSTYDSDLPPMHLPPVWDESLLVNTDLPPCDLPPVLGNHQAFLLGRTCQEFYETEVAFLAKLDVMSKLQVFFTKEKIQELCSDVSKYIPGIQLPLEVALKELLLTNNIQILKEFSQNVQGDLIRSDDILKKTIFHNEQDAAAEAFALTIASQRSKFSKAVINATFRHIQAFWDISNIFKNISSKINENKKSNPSELVPLHPWNKCMKQFIRTNKDLIISDSSFEGLFIDVMQRFPRIQLFAKDIKKHTSEFQTKQAQEFQNQELGKSVNEFEKVIENSVRSINERMKERDLLQEAQNILHAIEKSKQSGYTLAFDKNEKTPRVIAKKISYKKMIVGVALDDIHTEAQNHLTKGIEILNRRMGNQELAQYSSESEQEFNQRKKDILTNDMTLLKSLKDALKSISKQPEKSQKSISKENLKQLQSETKEVKSIEGSLSEGEKKTKKSFTPRSLILGMK